MAMLQGSKDLYLGTAQCESRLAWCSLCAVLSFAVLLVLVVSLDISRRRKVAVHPTKLAEEIAL